MYWPIMTDYQEAVQNPRFCFNDPDLRDGVVDLDPLGFPRPISGNFACVFNIAHLKSRWAVRCFLKNNPDQEKRYEGISACLARSPLPYFVPFHFLREGIRVKGKAYPLLKMEWIYGETLSAYVERNLNRPGLLDALADKFLALARDLDGHSIAHGDLQHGNILIVKDEIRLVDYDGMYVPALAGMLSNEIGHPNYQHPRRNEQDFGPYIDRFSEWVIYLSLKALSIDPTMWKAFKGGDENLLFRRADYEAPFSSDNLSYLETQGGDDLPRIAAFLREMIVPGDLPAIPPLDPVALLKLSQVGVTGRPSPVPTQPASASPQWVLDHLETARAVELPGALRMERRSLLVLVAALLITSFLFALGLLEVQALAGLLAGEASLDAAFLYLRYSQRPEVKEKRRYAADLASRRTRIAQVDANIAGRNQQIAAIGSEEKNLLHDLNAQRQALRTREQEEIIAVEAGSRKRQQEIGEQLAQIGNDENKELADLLAIIQEEYIGNQLVRLPLSQAAIPGVGQGMKKRLLAAGVIMAADLLDYHIGVSRWQQFERERTYLKIKGKGDVYVEGVGPAKARALLAWRRALEEQHRPKAPQALPPIFTATVKSKYAGRRAALNDQLAAAGREAGQKKDSIHSRYRADQARNQNDAVRIAQAHAAKKKEQEDQIAALLKDRSQLTWESTVLQKQLAAYQRVRFGVFLLKMMRIRG